MRAFPSGTPLVLAVTDAARFRAFELEQLLGGLGYRVIRLRSDDVLSLLRWAEAARRLLPVAERHELDEIAAKLGELVHERGAALELLTREIGWDRARMRGRARPLVIDQQHEGQIGMVFR